MNLKLTSIACFIIFFSVQFVFCQKIVDGKVVYHEKDSAYQPLYDSIKVQYIKKLQSPEYKKYKALRKSYNEKLGDNYNGVNIKGDPGHITWLTFFWPKTNFKNLAEAQYKWDEVEEAQDIENKKNKKITSLLTVMAMRYGPDVFLTLLQEMHTQYPEL